MADLLDAGSQWLDQQRTAHMTRTVTYERGASSVEVPATLGRTLFEQVDRMGLVQRTESRDFLVLAADLVLDGSEATPKAGDRIRDAAGSAVQLYEVMAPGSEPPFRYSDPYRRTLRIHTKHVGSEPLP